MTLRELLLELQAELAEYFEISAGFDRHLKLPDLPKKIKTLIGMRRTGKTHCLRQFIKSLYQQGVHPSRILYVNFEDDRLYPVSQEKFQKIISAFYDLYPKNYHQLCYLILDEIQVVEEWQRVIRRLFDTKQVQMYLTGSSAKLLSSEIATELRGRSYAIEVWPLSFLEFLEFKNYKYTLSNTMTNSQKAHLKKALEEYLKTGGFPEILYTDLTEHHRILQDYVNVVIFRDIVERHKISNLPVIRYLIKTLLKNVGSFMSFNKLYNDSKSQGFPLATDTLHNYLTYIQDAYLAFFVPLYSESLRKTESNPKKIYAVDTGLASAYTLSLSKNMGHLFENLIYLDLRRAGAEVYYYLTKDRYEVDFLAKMPDGKLELYQVSWNTEDTETLEREMRALDQASQELGIKGTLITPDVYFKTPWLRNEPLAT